MLVYIERKYNLYFFVYVLSLHVNIIPFSGTIYIFCYLLQTLQFCGRCRKDEARKRQRLKESEESDQCLASSCTIKDMIEQSSGSGSGLPLLVRKRYVMLDIYKCMSLWQLSSSR